MDLALGELKHGAKMLEAYVFIMVSESKKIGLDSADLNFSVFICY